MVEGEPRKLIPLGYRLSDNLGRAGVEKMREDDLRGKRGGRVVERNYKQGSEEVLLEVASKAGAQIRLNLDLHLQAVAEKELGNRPSAVVVMNVEDGAVLVMASRPGYDPTAFSPPRNNAKVKQLLADENKPLINRTTQGCYPLGSVFKLVTAIAGMETGRITRDSTSGCIGFHEVGGRQFKCWKTVGHGQLRLEQAIQQSCNVFFYKLAEKTGPKPIAMWGEKLGYGSRTGVDMPHERSGLLPSPSNIKRHWTGGDTLNLCIGQGSVQVTPLQVARCIAAIANGGYLVTPRVMESTPIVRKKVEIRSRTLDVVRNGMWMVVNTAWGTGVAACQRNVDVAGKTATAEVQGKKDHAWFAAFGPYRKPEICIAVIVEHGGKGGHTAAPIAGEVLKEYFKGRKRGEDSAPVGYREMLPNRNNAPAG
jgi:penicillin-binding protein 2